jgi:gliding motility-associated-like protein
MKKNLSRFLLLLFAITATTISHLYAQEKASQHARYAGKEFWFTTGNNGNVNEFLLSGKYNASVTFTYTTNNTSYTATVPANTVVKMPLPQMNQTTMSIFETVMNRSLHIVSDSDVVVQYAAWGGVKDDGSLIYPSDGQRYGNVYYLSGLPYLTSTSTTPGGGGFSIVAACDSVAVEITPAKDLMGYPAGVPFTITLNKGETYSIASSGTNTPRDISGTKIEVKSASCCNPINVFNTGACGVSYWPYTATPVAACDFFFEQILPVSSWDTSYYVLPYYNNPYTIVKIVSSANNNVLSLNGNSFATLNTGGTLDTIIREPVHISSSFPVSVSQHMVGQLVSYPVPVLVPDIGEVDSLSDPNSAMVVSMRDGIRDAWFQTVGQRQPNGPSGGIGARYNYFHALAMVSKTDNVGSIMLNNNSIASQFHPYPGNPGYSYAYIKPDTGVQYHLISSDKITANYYAAAYCGSTDFALGDINSLRLYNELATDTINVCALDSITLEATPGISHQWSTGETTATITVSDTGQYSVVTEHGANCVSDLQVFVLRYNQGNIHSIDLGSDTTICKGDQIVLNGQDPSTVWSTGFVGDGITIHEPGIYWAMAFDTCTQDLSSDTIIVTEDPCLWKYCNFHFPNAFSPNGDGLNDLLLPVYYGELTKYRLSVFNRFGQRVFSTSRPDEGWDGMMKGQTADVGVYFYHCVYYCPLQGDVELKGDITLIR